MKDREQRFSSAEELILLLDRGEASSWWQDRSRESRIYVRRPTRRLRVPRETKVYGREADLASLRRCFDAAREGEGSVVLIEGEAGIGKSRLVDELVRQLREEGEELHFLFGSYPPGGAATPLSAWSSAYLEHFGTEGLDETLMRYLRVTPLLVPAFAALLRCEPPPPEVQSLTMDSLQAAFVNATRALSSEHPIIVLIDDLHFAPPEGLAFFSALALALREHRVLLLGTSWPGLDENWWAGLERLPHVSEVKLPRLTKDAVETLLTDALCSPATVAELLGRVASQSDGNPLFVFEILRSLKERGDLQPARGGRWVVKGRVEEIVIPSTVVRIIEARLAGLDESDRSLLEVAACCTSPFDPLVISDALELPRLQVLRNLARIERESGVLRSCGRCFEFDHRHIRAHLYEGLPEVLRSEYHGVIARTLEAAGASRKGPAAAEICGHYLHCEHPEGAAPRLTMALDHLVSTYQNGRAIKLLRLALAAGFSTGEERVDLLMRLASVLELRGRLKEQGDALREALTLAEETMDTRRCALARGKLGRLYEAQGEIEQALPMFQAAVRDAEQAGDPEALVQSLNLLGAHLHRRGQPDESRTIYLEARDIAEKNGHQRAVMSVLGNLGILAWEQGRPDEARANYEASLEFFREAGDLRTQANLIGLLGILLDDLGKYREAAKMHARQLEINRDIGYRRGVSNATSNLGDSLRQLGRLAEARHHFEEDERISEEIGDRAGVASALINIGAIHRQLGENREAQRCFRRSLSLSREVSAAKEEGLALHYLGGLMLQSNRPRRAVPLLQEGLRIFRKIRFRGGEGWARLALGISDLNLMQFEEAGAHLAAAATIGEESGLVSLHVLGLCQLTRTRAAPVLAEAALIEKEQDRLEPYEHIEAWYAIWKADGAQEYLVRCREILREFETPLDRQQRETLMTGVAIYGEIHHAWNAVTG